MSDLTPMLPPPEDAGNIPAALAAPRPRRAKAKPADVSVAAEALAPVEPAPSLPTAAASAGHSIEEPNMTDTVENMTQDTTAHAQAMLGDISDRAKGAMEKGTALFADWSSFGRANVEALVESGKIAMSGLSTLAQDRAAFVRKQMEDTTAAVRTMTSAKSPTEFVKLQGDFVRGQFDAAVAETSRTTEAALKLAGEVAQPISNRFALAAEKVRQAA